VDESIDSTVVFMGDSVLPSRTGLTFPFYLYSCITSQHNPLAGRTSSILLSIPLLTIIECFPENRQYYCQYVTRTRSILLSIQQILTILLNVCGLLWERSTAEGNGPFRSAGCVYISVRVQQIFDVTRIRSILLSIQQKLTILLNVCGLLWERNTEMVHFVSLGVSILVCVFNRYSYFYV